MTAITSPIPGFTVVKGYSTVGSTGFNKYMLVPQNAHEGEPIVGIPMDILEKEGEKYTGFDRPQQEEHRLNKTITYSAIA